MQSACQYSSSAGQYAQTAQSYKGSACQYADSACNAASYATSKADEACGYASSACQYSQSAAQSATAACNHAHSACSAAGTAWDASQRALNAVSQFIKGPVWGEISQNQTCATDVHSNMAIFVLPPSSPGEDYDLSDKINVCTNSTAEIRIDYGTGWCGSEVIFPDCWKWV